MLPLQPTATLESARPASSYWPRWPDLVYCSGLSGPPAGCDDCGTVVVAATGEPSSLVPPLVFETVGRDIGDQVFERLAVSGSRRLAPRCQLPIGRAWPSGGNGSTR